MKPKQLVFLFLIFGLTQFALPLKAQKSDGLKGRHNIKVSHRTYKTFRLDREHLFQVEYNKGVMSFLELGGYLGTQPGSYRFEVQAPPPQGFMTRSNSTTLIKYGIQANVHPLQLIIPEGHRFRFDVYLTFKAGGLFIILPENALKQKQHGFDYDFGAGLAYHFFKHWGLFTEYNTTIRELKEDFKFTPPFRYGVSIKF